MYSEPSTSELVRQAASALILEGFEENQDLWLPHGFCLTQKGLNLIIAGPCSHKYDDYIAKGIWINTYSFDCAYARINPFEGLNKKSSFEYANPAFPDNLFQFVSEGICDWLCWWDTFKEEELTEDQSSQQQVGENDVCNRKTI